MTYKVFTLGCKVNTYESMYLENELQKIGYLPSINPSWVILNTCSVTDAAENKVKKMYRRILREHPLAKLVVIGCHSQIYFNDLLAEPNIKILLGNSGKSKVAAYILKYDQTGETTKYINDLQKTCFDDMFIDNFDNRKRAFIKIQDGCDNYCSYCIIPTTRGSLRSKKMEIVVDEINQLVLKGYREIVLTGIHTGKYNDGCNNFYDLLVNIINLTNLERIRISSIEINELTDEILNLLKNPRFMTHLHIPLQSGSDEMLKLMNRKYKKAYFISRITDINKKLPKYLITTDIIVGHPQETEELFLETLDTLNKLRFSNIHVFPYSSRKGTISSTMPDLDKTIKKDRVKTIINLNKEINNQVLASYHNQLLTVLVEKKTGNYYFGHSNEYLPVYIKSNQDLENRVIDLLVKLENGRLVGEIND